jgi:hypothetical protein
MQASIRKEPSGKVALLLDEEAAQAAYASIVFAARFHDGLRPLAKIVEQKLMAAAHHLEPRRNTCR